MEDIYELMINGCGWKKLLNLLELWAFIDFSIAERTSYHMNCFFTKLRAKQVPKRRRIEFLRSISYNYNVMCVIIKVKKHYLRSFRKEIQKIYSPIQLLKCSANLNKLSLDYRKKIFNFLFFFFLRHEYYKIIHSKHRFNLVCLFFKIWK